MYFACMNFIEIDNNLIANIYIRFQSWAFKSQLLLTTRFPTLNSTLSNFAFNNVNFEQDSINFHSGFGTFDQLSSNIEQQIIITMTPSSYTVHRNETARTSMPFGTTDQHIVAYEIIIPELYCHLPSLSFLIMSIMSSMYILILLFIYKLIWKLGRVDPRF